jgi:hypothetical protein
MASASAHCSTLKTGQPELTASFTDLALRIIVIAIGVSLP